MIAIIDLKGHEVEVEYDVVFVDNSFSHEFGIEEVINKEIDDIAVVAIDGYSLDKKPKIAEQILDKYEFEIYNAILEVDDTTLDELRFDGI